MHISHEWKHSRWGVLSASHSETLDFGTVAVVVGRSVGRSVQFGSFWFALSCCYCILMRIVWRLTLQTLSYSYYLFSFVCIYAQTQRPYLALYEFQHVCVRTCICICMSIEMLYAHVSMKHVAMHTCSDELYHTHSYIPIEEIVSTITVNCYHINR